MTFVGEPFDATYFEQRANPTDPQRDDGYTSYVAINPAHWMAIADNIEFELELVNGKDVLDAGGAHGFLAEELRSRGATVTVIDFSAYAVGEGSALHPSVTFQQADIVAGIGGPPNRYDLIVGTGIHDCMPDDANIQSLHSELNRLLTPQGSAYFLFSLVHDDYPTRPLSFWQTEGANGFPGKDISIDAVGDILPFDGRMIAKEP